MSEKYSVLNDMIDRYNEKVDELKELNLEMESIEDFANESERYHKLDSWANEIQNVLFEGRKAINALQFEIEGFVVL